MLRNYKCSFCGHDIARGTGVIYVKTDGSILRFCSRKCRVSQVKMKRNPRKLKWTTRYETKF
ncbi:MAG: 50S ribosomal protein L24e [Candidatus Kariarchaeaceae archaeon]|jgi:large subunit ribosomal protein L24e